MADRTAETGAPAHRFTYGLIEDVFAVLDQHGYRRGDDQAVGHAVEILIGLVKAYEGGEAK